MTKEGDSPVEIPWIAINKCPRLLPMHYRLGEAAQELGISVSLLRHWQRHGLSASTDPDIGVSVHGRALAEWISRYSGCPPVNMATDVEIAPDNFAIVQTFLEHLSRELQLDPASVTVYRTCLRRLLLWAGRHSLYEAAHIRPTLPVYLSTVITAQAEKPLTGSTIKKTLRTCQRFFRWAEGTHPRKYGAISDGWISSLVAIRKPRQTKKRTYYSLEEALKLATCGTDEHDLAHRRDQAAAALLFLSGMRGGAFVSLPISAVDLATGTIQQLTELGVRTKNHKSALTYLLPIPELLEVVRNWDDYIRACLPVAAMWYTPILCHRTTQRLSSQPAGRNRHVALAKRLRLLCQTAQVDYRSPHKLRHGHAVWALQHAQTLADYKAISQNLMHANLSITDGIYAVLQEEDVRRRIAALSPTAGKRMAGSVQSGLTSEELAAVLRKLADQLSGGADQLNTAAKLA